MNWVSITPVVLSRTRRTSVSVGTYSGDMMRLMFSKKLGKEEEGGGRRRRQREGCKKVKKPGETRGRRKRAAGKLIT